MRLHQINILLFQDRLDAAEALLATPVQGVLEGQRAHLLSRLARLRNPAPMVAQTTAESPISESATEEVVREAPLIPEFQRGELRASGNLSSAALVALAAETPMEPEVDLAPTSDARDGAKTEEREEIPPESESPEL